MAFSFYHIIAFIMFLTNIISGLRHRSFTSSLLGGGSSSSSSNFYATRLFSSNVNFYAASEEELKALLQEWKQPVFRAEQIRRWVYQNGVVDFDDMANLPKPLRDKLKSFYSIGTLKLASELISKDGTIKRAYELPDGQLIEAVLMPYEDGRRTACISSQAGCAMGCV
jgi:hypothetical protein